MSKKKKAQEKKSKIPVFPIVVAAIVIAGLFVVFGLPSGKNQSKTTRSFMVTGGETRPVIDPRQFTGMTRDAYAAAMEVPEIIDKIYCYCYCDDPPFNHKSLLSCFVDYHGAS